MLDVRGVLSGEYSFGMLTLRDALVHVLGAVDGFPHVSGADSPLLLGHTNQYVVTSWVVSYIALFVLTPLLRTLVALDTVTR